MRQSIRALDKRRLVHLSSHCDAVEELIRYAEASEDKKLQPHPAYLEARRVLQMHAERLSGQSLVAQAPQPASSRPQGSPTTTDSAATSADSVPTENPPGRPLPPMRMARIW